MAAAKDTIICHVCGFKNTEETIRCVSCGAKLEDLAPDYDADDEARHRNQNTGFEIRWVGAAFVIYLVLQAIALAVLPALIPAYDPQGFNGLLVSAPVWFIGGLVIGLISPGRTFLEPAVGASVAVFPTIAYLAWVTPGEIGEGLEPTMMAYVVGGIMGIMVSLFGAFLGERLQGLTRGHRP